MTAILRRLWTRIRPVRRAEKRRAADQLHADLR